MEATLIISGGILLGCMLALSWFAGSDAPYVPTKMERIKKILKIAGIKKNEVFYELGSGDGRVVIQAAKMGAASFGIEQSWIRVLISRWNAKKQNLTNAHFIHGDLYDVIARSETTKQSNSLIRLPRPFGARNDVGNADLIFIFLLPKGVEKLEPIFKKNLKKGARVITQTFHFEHWRPYRKILITENIPNTLLGKKKYEGDFWLYLKT